MIVCAKFSFLSCLEVAEKFVVGGGAFHRFHGYQFSVTVLDFIKLIPQWDFVFLQLPLLVIYLFRPSTTCLFCSLMNNLSTLLYTSASLMIFSRWEMKIFVCYILSSSAETTCLSVHSPPFGWRCPSHCPPQTSQAHSVDIYCDWKSKAMKPHLTSLNVGHPMFIVKCGAASNLKPVLGMLRSDWSRHHMIFISMPLLKLKSTFTRSDL